MTSIQMLSREASSKLMETTPGQRHQSHPLKILISDQHEIKPYKTVYHFLSQPSILSNDIKHVIMFYLQQLINLRLMRIDQFIDVPVIETIPTCSAGAGGAAPAVPAAEPGNDLRPDADLGLGIASHGWLTLQRTTTYNNLYMTGTIHPTTMISPAAYPSTRNHPISAEGTNKMGIVPKESSELLEFPKNIQKLSLKMPVRCFLGHRLQLCSAHVFSSGMDLAAGQTSPTSQPQKVDQESRARIQKIGTNRNQGLNKIICLPN